MNIGEVITASDYTISPLDSKRRILDKMADLRLAHLPVVEGELYLGLVSYETLAGQKHMDENIREEGLHFQQLHLFGSQHIYDGLLFFQIHQLDILPIIDDEHGYLGAITPLELANALSQTMSVNLPGGIIVLEMGYRDNALSHIAHIVESDNAQILNSYVRMFSDSSRLEVTIKVNKTEISSIVASFLRHDYTVKTFYNDESSHVNAQDRYDQLMNYINM